MAGNFRFHLDAGAVAYGPAPVTTLTQADFRRGTYRITAPGTYVLGESILFHPAHPPSAHPELYGHPAYSMGFFAAITVESDNVVIDLGGHALQQAYTHYLAQRFFSLIELANAPFIPRQGPGSINTDHALVASSRCRITHGTLGLTSHSAVHGNNNSDITLSHLRITQFEVTGVQLNGVHGARLEDVQLQGIARAPLGDMAFTFLRHARLMEEKGGAAEPVLGAPAEDVRAAARHVRALLRHPFEQAEQEDPRQRDAPRQLARIHAALAAAAADPAHAEHSGIPLHLDKLVNAAGLPDGSALYGVLINSTGVAVHQLAAVCPAAAGQGQPGGGPACRRSRNVSLVDVHMSDMNLHAVETIGIKVDGAILKDRTGALIKVDHLLHCPNSLLSHMRLAHNAGLRAQPGLVDAMRHGGAAARAFLDGPGVTTFGNADIMAHVAKGILCMRIEDTDGVALTRVRVRRVRNTSGTGASMVPDESLAGMPHRFRGVDIRILFAAHCTGLAVDDLDVHDVATTHGQVHMIEMDHVQDPRLGTVTTGTVRPSIVS